eukprot:1347739-Rhodomonas_salina.1
MTGMAPVTMHGNAAPVRLGVCREGMCRAAAWDGVGWGGEWGDGELAATSGVLRDYAIRASNYFSGGGSQKVNPDPHASVTTDAQERPRTIAWGENPVQPKKEKARYTEVTSFESADKPGKKRNWQR